MLFDKVILSTNDDPKYYQWWPIVAHAWKHFWPLAEVVLAYVTDRGEDDERVIEFRKHGTVTLYKPLEGIPTANHAKVARYFLAGNYPDKVCLIGDVDLMPLSRFYLDNKLAYRCTDQLLTIGAEEYYFIEEDIGKAPAALMTALGKIFFQLYGKDVTAFTNLSPVMDNKEIITNNPCNFSDESLTRLLLRNCDIDVVNKTVGLMSTWDTLDRSDWLVDLDRLFHGGYAYAHLPRPYNPKDESITPLLDYIGYTDYEYPCSL